VRCSSIQAQLILEPWYGTIGKESIFPTSLGPQHNYFAARVKRCLDLLALASFPARGSFHPLPLKATTFFAYRGNITLLDWYHLGT
jgi:hypothetical protein